jgi:RHS repeat-associated protein
LGSVVGSLDANSGVIESQRAYKPFGDDLLMRGTIPTTLGYTGQRQEPELGLYYYNARWYDPYLARFTQPDTIVPNPTDAKAFDRYAYVYNNPVMYSDPSGHCVESNGQETGQGGVGYACPGSTWKKTDPIISSGNSDGGTETSVEPDATQGGGEGWVIYGPPPPPLPTPVIIEPDKIKIVTKVELNLDPNYQHPEDVSGPSHPIADLTGLLLQAADWSCNVLNQLCPPRGRTGLVTVSLIIDRSGPGSDRAMGVEVNNYAMNSLGINVFTEYGDSYGYESLNVGERAYFDVPNTPLATLSDIHVRIGNGRIEETVGAKIPLPEALNTSLVGTTVVPYFDQPVLLPADYQWR